MTATGTLPVAGRARQQRRPRARKAPANTAERAPVYVDGAARNVPIYARASLALGTRLDGPAIVTEYSSTILVAGGWRLRVDGDANLWMEAARG